MNNLMLPLPGLSPVSGKTVVVKFDGGLLSSDGGILVLRERLCAICSGERGSSMQAARRSATRRRCSTAGGDFDEPQAQRVELRNAPHRAPGHRCAQAPHQPARAGVQEQPELVGRGLRA
jgi:hypothetical protein